MDNPDLQAIVNKVWPALMKEVEKRSTSMEQDLIKRHNIRMMNEMQEVVRQIKIAKVRNDEVLRAYHAKHGELTRAVTDVVEKQQSMNNDIEDVKRKMAQLKQELTLRCGQNTEQLAQLKHTVFTAWQKEKSDVQQRVTQLYRSDLALVLQQCEMKLKENHSQVIGLKKQLRKLTAKVEGNNDDDDEEEEDVATEDDEMMASSSFDLTKILHDSKVDDDHTQPTESKPQQQASTVTPSSGVTTTTPNQQQPTTNTATTSTQQLLQQQITAAQQQATAFAGQSQQRPGTQSSSSSPAPSSVSGMSNISKSIAEVLSSNPAATQSGIAQLMANLPRQQQIQLQLLVQQQQQARQQQQAAQLAATTNTAAAAAHQQQQAARTAAQASASAAAHQEGKTQQATGQEWGGMIQALANKLGTQVPLQQQQQGSTPTPTPSPSTTTQVTNALPPSSSATTTTPCPFFTTFGWCKFGDKCRYVHTSTGREPLRHLPPAMIAQLQQQLSAQVQSGQITGSVGLTQAIAASARQGAQHAAAQAAAQQAAQQQQQQRHTPTATPPPPSSIDQHGARPQVSTTSTPLSSAASATRSGGPTNQQSLMAAQIACQQEAMAMGRAKAKTLPCKFHQIGSGFSGLHLPTGTQADVTAQAAAKAWGTTGLGSNAGAWTTGTAAAASGGAAATGVPSTTTLVPDSTSCSVASAVAAAPNTRPKQLDQQQQQHREASMGSNSSNAPPPPPPGIGNRTTAVVADGDAHDHHHDDVAHEEDVGIRDGEDDTEYDQWNAMTFDLGDGDNLTTTTRKNRLPQSSPSSDFSGPPPGLGIKQKGNEHLTPPPGLVATNTTTSSTNTNTDSNNNKKKTMKR
ncbi:hypothetical protein Pmar_PMAR005895 [Perkinsus marinus ATCC 50983]|uniref:C3H1-type domain-containing protein n=1 Tax=Perkinsus marinus (strain ATCC 50983 / TXsc) TaxID=423536 RepID=C5LKZ0_PERM5|nr:hypothetical protein Pmar_PMAR005895 [Perkinsus marinus ATCC 50983]EER02554.1 hypothetical protein Pmar_PMAR005895 [Perkinsus marinus ATCC 50983]|eukprot:XP_002769836.1 hypothetical protein Pmar_PMAR005895 [Perkinsus marinus ATCC 50983]